VSLCLTASGKTVALALEAFTLIWSHSVEKSEWREDWRIFSGRLVIERASVAGTGAGMDIPEGAQLRDGVWIYEPDRQPVDRLRLMDAGRPDDDWTLCDERGNCRGVRELLDSRGREVILEACMDRAGAPLGATAQ
jgi:hypothetical protein